MVVRAADQLQWDVGVGAEPRPLYGSAAVVRGGSITGTGSTVNGEEERTTPGLHHLTARVYPPLLDYCVTLVFILGLICHAECQ